MDNVKKKDCASHTPWLKLYRAVELLGVETIAITAKRRNKCANLKGGSLRGNRSVIQDRVGRSDF
jgi:hypothetical protein